MEWLNYHHLLYFWTAATRGGVSRAARELRLSPSTVSGQLRLLEAQVGEPLFTRAGRGLALTEVGRLVLRHADEIFSIGRSLQDALRGRPSGQPPALQVGIADVVPKLVSQRLLAPALALPHPFRLVCREDRYDRLVADLATHDLDVVISDAPVSPSLPVRAFNHLLGECAVEFFATPRMAAGLRRGFPASLDGAPVLLPTQGTTLRRALDEWFAGLGIRPRVVAEIEDSALLKAFGQAGAGAFPAAAAVSQEVQRQHRVGSIGRVESVRERFYAITIERRLSHPAVLAISASARAEVFGAAAGPPPDAHPADPIARRRPPAAGRRGALRKPYRRY